MIPEDKRILIVGPAWVGDMVMAQSLFKTLKAINPEALIDVLAPEWSKPLLQRMSEVNQAISQPLGHGQLGLMARYRLGKQLRVHRYDTAITLPRSFKSALVPLFARARLRSGYRGEMRYGLLNDIHPLDKRVLTQTVQRYVALGLPVETTLPPTIPEPELQIDRQNQSILQQRFNLSLDKPIAALMPGAEYGPAKQWPITHYIQLAGLLIKHGYQVWLFGSEKDQQACAQIKKHYPQDCVDLSGKTQLVDAVDLMALSTIAVTNDSGMMHVAAAVGTHVVALYGSSTPDYTPPLTKRSSILYQRLECSPCFERQCPLGHLNCLNSINAEMVMQTIQALPDLNREKTNAKAKGG